MLADNDIFRHNVNNFTIGHQWGGPDYRKVNQALSCNFTNGAWSYFDMARGLPLNSESDTSIYAHKLALHNLNPSIVNYLGWDMSSWSEFPTDSVQHQYFRSWMGMRWEPAENAEPGDTWSPRDSTSWPYGFEARHHQSAPPASTDTNYRRFVLDTALISGTMPVKVLDSCNPRTSLFGDVSRGGDVATDSTDGRRMFLVINLRRLDWAVVTPDDSVVLRLQVRGNRFEPNPANPDPLERDPIHFIFDSVPNPNGTAIYNLRENRGRVLSMVGIGTDTTNEVLITRQMLPSGANRDITITAEFRTDSSRIFTHNANTDNWDRTNAQMKRVEFLGHGTPGVNAHNIDTITPVVWFYDKTSVAIQSISIVTPYTFHVLCGAYDEAFAMRLSTAMLNITDVRNYYRDSVGSTQPLYIEHIYAVDEFGVRDELGMYYRSHLLNGFCNSETGYEGSFGHSNYTTVNGRKRIHMMPFSMIWTSGLGFTGTQTPSPMFPYSSAAYEGAPYKTLSLREGYMFGQHVDPLRRPYSASFETFGNTNILGSYEQFGIPLASKFATDSVYERIMSQHVLVGAMGSWEKMLYIHFYKIDWFFTKPTKPWITHGFYHYRTNLGWAADSTVPYVHFGVWRPQSGEEIRLELSSAIAFGAKGFAYDKLFDLPSRRHVPPTAVVNSTGGHLNAFNHIEPGLVTNTYTHDWDTRAWFDSVNILQSDSLGGDYIPVNHHWHFDEFRHRDSISQAMQLNRCYGIDSTNRVYLGQKSMRCEMKKWHDLVMHPDFNDVMYRMRPVAWYGSGYRKLIKGTMTDMSYWIDTTKATMKMYQWTKDDATDTVHDLRSEPVDERMYDYVLLDLATGSAPVHDSCVLAVINRRTAPGIIDAAHTDSIEVLSTYDFDQRVLSDSTARYTQIGARRIVIPFNYSQHPTQPVNLRVRELSLDSAVRIVDTVIGATTELAVDFKPGQTRFFKITTVPATEGTVRGFLDHSNQRKLVAFPKLDTLVSVEDTVDGRTYLRMVIGDTMRYHQVYHRRRQTATGENGFLTVYYRRSTPILTKDTSFTDAFVFDASTIVWENEQVISDRILYDPPGIIGDTIWDLSCGYPALVVRPLIVNADSANCDTTSRVYVVFGCEFSHILPIDTVLVCETILPADSLRTTQVTYYNAHPSQVLDVTPAPIAPILEHWGTPMINASQHGNFYCWSHVDNGIGTGFKIPTALQFVAGQTMYIKARPAFGPIWYETHPSLNSYSRLQIGEEDAALVWQEGDAPDQGQFIFYTRLRHGVGPGYPIRYELTNSAFRTTTGAVVEDALDPDIGMITDTWISVDSTDYGASHAFPVVYRHLSDWETTPTNSRHTLRLVNHKADRVFWQSHRTLFGPGPWVIGRRAIDVAEYSLAAPYWIGYNDELYSTPEHFIFSLGVNLRGPDVSQGEQWGELGSVPNNPLPNYDDSCSVLNFSSDTDDTDPEATIWHMLYGFNFYGSTVDHDHADLVSSGLLEQIHGYGHFSHLAARYSVSAHRGYQRSRRVYNETGGVWANYVTAPLMRSSSEYFYKLATEEEPPQGLVYSGFRGAGCSATLGPILVQSSKEWIALGGEADKKSTDANTQTLPDKFASPWMELPDVSDLTFSSSVYGKAQAGTLYIERESDGERLEVEVMSSLRDKDVLRETYTFVGGADDRFRFVLEPAGKIMLGVKDVEIVMPEGNRLEKSSKIIRYSGLLDLNTMARTRSVSNSIHIYPNPASESTSIVFDLRSKEGLTADIQRASIIITDLHGLEMGRMACLAVDAVSVNTAVWPSGMYNVTVRTDEGVPRIVTTRFTVIR